MAYFPMFLNIEKKHCLVVGGGTVAYRKVLVLLDFGAQVTVIAPEVLPQIRSLDKERVEVLLRTFAESDLKGCALVVAATGDEEQNHAVSVLAQAQNIPVNAVDQKEDCTFIFPSYVRRQNLVGAFSSGGNSPVMTQYLKHRCEEVLQAELGEVNEYMGSIRDVVKEQVSGEALRKKVYCRVLEELLPETGGQSHSRKTALSDEKLQDIIAQILEENG